MNDSDTLRVVAYVLVAIFGTGGAIASVWGLFKVVIPRIIDTKLEQEKKRLEAELEGEKDSREFTQEERRLALDYSKTEATEAQRMLGEIISDLQTAKEKGDEFVRTTVFDGIDSIKTNTDYIPILKQDLKDINHRLTELETKHRLLIDLLTGGLITIGGDHPTGNYETWKTNKLGRSTNDKT